MRVALIKLLKDVLTGIDGESFDAWRLAALLALVALIGNATYANAVTHTFSATDFGAGCAAILGCAAWGIKQKQNTEPGAGQ